MNELIAHLVGDYILQNHWMANEKVKRWFPAFVHGFFYTLPFLFLTQNPIALLIIGGTHVVIDRFRLAKIVARIRNWCFTDTSFPEETPIWLTFWLMIITDNTIHLIINHFALMTK